MFEVRELTLVVLIAALFIFFGCNNSNFLGKTNIEATILSVAITGIVGVGATLALSIGGLDLSVGAVVALVCAVMGNVFLSTKNVVVGMIVGLAVGGAFGCINAMLITKCRLGTFIATLVTQQIARGLTMVLTKGTPVNLTYIPDWTKKIGNGKLGGVLSYIILIFIIVTIVGQILLKKSKVLRKVLYIGSNPTAAHYSGINVQRTNLGVYITIGLLCGVAGILSVCRFYSAAPNYGQGMETELIAAAVIGGASLEGGNGSIAGTAIALIMLGFVQSGIVLMGVSVYWQDMVSNLILLAAVLLDAFVEMRRRRK